MRTMDDPTLNAARSFAFAALIFAAAVIFGTLLTQWVGNANEAGNAEIHLEQTQLNQP